MKSLIDNGGGMKANSIGPKEIAQGELKRFDIVVVPGGSSTQQFAKLGLEGRKRIREFVGSGGGFVGICAGAFLGSSSNNIGLGLVNVDFVDGTGRFAHTGRLGGIGTTGYGVYISEATCDCLTRCQSDGDDCCT